MKGRQCDCSEEDRRELVGNTLCSIEDFSKVRIQKSPWLAGGRGGEERNFLKVGREGEGKGVSGGKKEKFPEFRRREGGRVGGFIVIMGVESRGAVSHREREGIGD